MVIAISLEVATTYILLELAPTIFLKGSGFLKSREFISSNNTISEAQVL